MKLKDVVDTRVENIVPEGQSFFIKDVAFYAIDKDGNEERIPMLKNIKEKFEQTMEFQGSIYSLRQDDNGNLYVIQLTEEEEILARKKKRTY